MIDPIFQDIEPHDVEGMKLAIKRRSFRDLIGNEVAKAYPKRPWHIAVSEDCTTATVIQPQISSNWGCVIHLSHSQHEVQAKAVKYAGELLERFNLSRNKIHDGLDILKLKRRIDGEALGVKRGEAE